MNRFKTFLFRNFSSGGATGLVEPSLYLCKSNRVEKRTRDTKTARKSMAGRITTRLNVASMDMLGLL